MQRYRNYAHVIAGGDFHSEGGAWRSIYQFYKHLEETGKPCLLVDLRRGDGLKQWIAAVLFSPRVIVNGMSALSRWAVLLALLIRKDAAVYLHDTGHSLDEFQRRHPVKYRFLNRILRTHRVLCVSGQMEELYRRRFKSENTAVVYEVTRIDPKPVLDPEQVHVVMVGSLNRRKGYPLFLEVARLARDRGLPWRFHWVGGLGEAGLGEVPPVIKWWGWRESAAPLVEQADVFFLSSVDDPQPLACLEALAAGRRAVVYAGTGSAELIRGQAGCRVFQDYNAESALCALQSALQEKVDQGALRNMLAETCGVEAFEKRLVSLSVSLKESEVR